MKKALFLGIGAAQVDAIHYLKKNGWWVIGCGNHRQSLGINLVDQFELIDITDTDHLEFVGKRENISLVYSVGSDLAMPSVAAIAQRLHLPTFITPDIAARMHDKSSVRLALDQLGLNSVLYRRASHAADLFDWDCFPSIIKPVDNQGQRGIFLVSSYEEMISRFPDALRCSRQGIVIVEEYLDGTEISVNLFVLNGQIYIIEISDRLIVPSFTCGIPRGHILPSQTCQGELRQQVVSLVSRCLQVLGIKNGPVYFQIKLTSNGPRVVEITPRLDGCHLWRLIKIVRGIDLLAISFRWLFGEPLDDFNVVNYFNDCNEAVPARLMFHLNVPGATFDPASYPLPPEVLYFEYYLERGQVVPTINGHLEKVGYYIAWGIE
ncbi:MAG: ATP-grasp domain-containing protein [Methylococcales bacterium]|jgi:carbamoylphosphate synthase large subunit|nr:ATP-grasp domain-containing protein [Methylococcales bacterium]